jgi:hypothetical protein
MSKRAWIVLLCIVIIVLVFCGVPRVTRAANSNAGWISSTCYSHSRPDDPLVYPNQPGASHQHDFVGGLDTDAFSTPDSVRAGGTCSGTSGDTVAEWVPALTTSTKGTIVPSATKDRDVLTYYRNPSGIRSVQPFPDGFGMILGNAHAISQADNPAIAAQHLWWKCGPGGNTHLSIPPSSCPSGSYMVIVFTFPQFWDGIQTPAIDQLGHMSYTRDTAHPIILPRLQIFVRYSQATGTIGTVSQASGPWYTAHIDYWNTWQSTAFDALLARCMNAGVDCGTDPTP